jgi:hypothetical protein
MGAWDFIKETALNVVDPTGLGRAAVDYVAGDDEAEQAQTSLPSSDTAKPPLAKRGFDGFDSDRFIPPELREKMAAERGFQSDLDREEPNRDRNRDGYRRAAFRVGQDYTDESPEVDPDAEVDLSSPEARMAALQGFTQNYKMDGMAVDGKDAAPGDNRCGATSLLAGAMLADGNQGVQAMIDMVKADPEAAQLYGGTLDDLTKKITEGGALTQSDLHLVQSGVHDHLRKEHERAGFDPTSTGVDGKIIQDKIKHNQQLNKYFSDENLSVNFIDNDGDDSPNHFVLDIGEKGDRGHAVYDPFSREGGQVVEKSGQLRDYHLARHHTFAP